MYIYIYILLSSSSSSLLLSNRFGLYYGDYEFGKKSGLGVEFDDTGIYK
jgi:hypothetical protein